VGLYSVQLAGSIAGGAVADLSVERAPREPLQDEDFKELFKEPLREQQAEAALAVGKDARMKRLFLTRSALQLLNAFGSAALLAFAPYQVITSSTIHAGELSFATCLS
jgi:hypothetical protein